MTALVLAVMLAVSADRCVVSRTAEATILSTATAPPTEAPAFIFRLAGYKNREWPADVAVEVADGARVCTWTIPKAEAAAVQSVRIAPGAYKLTVKAAHHQTLVYPRLQIQGAKTADLGLLTLAPAIRLIGKVTNAERPAQPVAEAVIAGVDGTRLAVTDRAGVFAFETAAAPQAIAISRSGYADRLVSVSRSGATVDLGAIRLVKGVTLACAIDRMQLDEPVVLDIELYQEWGVDRSLRRCRAERVTKERKAVRFEGLEPGRYVALIKGPDELRQFTTPIDVGEVPLTTETIVISPVHLRLNVEYGGEPLPGARVSLANEGRLQRRVWHPELVTNGDGAIEGELWQSGQLFADVRHDLFDSVFPDSREVGASEVALWTISVPRQTILGSVRDAETGEPVASARVTDAITRDGAPYTRVVRISDAKGEFRFATAVNGEHQIAVEAAGYAAEKPARVEVRDSAEQRVDIVLRRGETVKLAVIDGSGIPAAAAQVMDGFIETGERPRQVLIADDGGEVLITGRKGDRHEVVVLPLSGSFAALTVVNGETPPELAVHVPPGVGALRIEALTREGQALGGLHFLLRYNGTLIPPAAIATKGFLQHRRATATGPDGVLILDQLPEGTYELWPYTTDPDIGTRPPIATVRVTAGETNVRVVIEPK